MAENKAIKISDGQGCNALSTRMHGEHGGTSNINPNRSDHSKYKRLLEGTVLTCGEKLLLENYSFSIATNYMTFKASIANSPPPYQGQSDLMLQVRSSGWTNEAIIALTALFLMIFLPLIGWAFKRFKLWSCIKRLWSWIKSWLCPRKCLLSS